MSISAIKKVAQGVYGASRFFLKKNGPTIATTVGTGCMLGSAVYAGYATYKGFDTVAEDHRYRMGKQEMVEETMNDEEGKKLLDSFEHKVSKGMIIKERITNYILTGAKFVQLYAPAIGLATAGIGLIFGAHNVMAKRNAALSLAYTGLEAAYDAYRKRVQNKLGEDEEARLYSDVPELSDGSTDEKVEQDKVIMEETGWDTQMYRRVLDCRNSNYGKTFAANMIFLMCCEQALNAKLKYQGFLTLNDALKQLDMRQTNVGQIIGWTLDGNETRTNGDGYVQIIPPAIRALYEKGQEHSPIIPLEFNVDGPIYNKIDDVVRGGSESDPAIVDATDPELA